MPLKASYAYGVRKLSKMSKDLSHRLSFILQTCHPNVTRNSFFFHFMFPIHLELETHTCTRVCVYSVIYAYTSVCFSEEYVLLRVPQHQQKAPRAGGPLNISIYPIAFRLWYCPVVQNFTCANKDKPNSKYELWRVCRVASL